MVQINKGEFEEGTKVEERFIGESPSKQAKIAADTTFTDVTEGGVPITKAESIARENVEAMGEFPLIKGVKDYVVNPIYKAWDVKGRAIVDKLNPLDDNFFQERKNKADHYDKQQRLAFANYREKVDKTKNYLSTLASKYKDQADEVRATQGDEAANKILEDYFTAKNRILQSANLKQTDILGTPIDLDTYMLRDDMDLWTDNPDPYPWIQFSEKMAGTIYGTNKGYKWGEKLLTKKNIQKLNKVSKIASKSGPLYVRLGGWAGRGATHPWTIKTLGAIGVGGVGWGAADFGYELQLDTMNAAGKGKAYLEASDDVRANLIGKAIPEFLTFGPEGINRPDLAKRTYNAMDEAVMDMALSAPFFALRPTYNMLRSIAGSAPGIRMFDKGWTGKPKEVRKEFGETSATDDLLAAEHIWKKWGGDNVQIEKAGFNVPFVGNMLTRLTQSNVFDWLGTGGLSALPKLFPKSKILKGFETPSTARKAADEQIQLPMGKYMFSDAYIGGASKILGRAPWLGGLLVKWLGRHSNDWAKAFNNMLGDMAPIAHLAGMRELDLGRIMLKGAEKFRGKAQELNKKVLDIGATHGAIINDFYLRKAAEGVRKNRLEYWKSKIDPSTGKATKIPPEGGDPIVNFINRQILHEGSTGAMTVKESVGLKNQIMKLIQKHKDLDYAEDGVMALMKGWDDDIASLASGGLDDISKAFKEYDEFVANGLMLYGSDIAKKAGIKANHVGTNLKIAWDEKRAGQSLFNTILKSGTPQDVKIVKKLVGDQAFADGVELHIRNAFNNALGESAGGIRQFNFKQFKKDLGLIGGNTMERRIFEEALKGSKIVIRGTDKTTGMKREFSDEMWLGMAPSGRFADDAADFSKTVDGDLIRRNVPTLDDWQQFVQVLERTYKHGIPDVSAFMARKAVISNVNSGLTAFLPWSGTEVATKGGGSLLSFGLIKSIMGAWLMRYGGGVMGSPPSMRAFRNTLDDTLPETVRLNNWAKLITRHPEEWRNFQMDLIELERAQQDKEAGAEQMRDLRTKGEKLKDNVMNLGGEIMENVPKALDLYDKVIPERVGNIPIKNVPIIEKGAVDYAVDAIADEAEEIGPQSKADIPTAPATAGFGTNVSAPGSSLAMNTTMNPAAAGALYTGDTDAALAAQYGGGTQYAAAGGMMEMNPIMDNKGNYTKPQTEINDNPFVHKAKNGGIMGVL